MFQHFQYVYTESEYNIFFISINFHRQVFRATAAILLIYGIKLLANYWISL